MISGQRIKQAREICGLTQAQLADLVGLNQSNIARLEQGFYQPLDPISQGIAMATGFPLAFFRDEPVIDFPPGSLMYRKRAALKSQHKSMLRQLARLLFEIGAELGKEIGTISPKLPESTGDAVLDAQRTREAFGFSKDAPITNLVRAVERLGVFVIALSQDIDDHDAFSLWAQTDCPRPILAMSTGKAGDRLRFSVAHELGHLLLHRNIMSATKIHEREADTFASELLLPSFAMKLEMVPPLNLSKLAELKARWGASIQAILVRALQLGVVTLRQYKYLFQQISAKGWRTKEPVEIPVEKPRLLRQMIEGIYGSPVPTLRVAEELRIPERVVQQIVLNYAGKTSASKSVDNKLIAFKPVKVQFN
jgi:Zn-dependent peptidase ImmA (M78 family)/DNA-binding XRE family transcriptional regulator